MGNFKINDAAVVHPHLTTDPNNKRGCICTVVAIDNDVITVRFSDGSTGRYQDDCLILPSEL